MFLIKVADDQAYPCSLLDTGGSAGGGEAHLLHHKYMGNNYCIRSIIDHLYSVHTEFPQQT